MDKCNKNFLLLDKNFFSARKKSIIHKLKDFFSLLLLSALSERDRIFVRPRACCSALKQHLTWPLIN